MANEPRYAAFHGTRLVDRGPLRRVLATVKGLPADAGGVPVSIFDEGAGREVDFDLRGSLDEVLQRVAPAEPKRRVGRPRLGVISREVTLLPGHWAWLDRQRGGASSTLRRLVDAALRRDENRVAPQVDATYRIMSALAGNLPGFEEAARALYGAQWDRFGQLVTAWPGSVGPYFLGRLEEIRGLAGGASKNPAPETGDNPPGETAPEG